MARTFCALIALSARFTIGSVVKVSNGFLEGVDASDFWKYGSQSGDHSINKYLQDQRVPAEQQKPYTGKNFSKVTAFKGVPFAEPPLGDLRFKKPQPYKGQFSQRNLTRFGTGSNPSALNCKKHTAACQQLDFAAMIPQAAPNAWRPEGGWSEDCLTLDIYVPNEALAGEKVPVYFWLHGGGFFMGDSQQNDGKFLAAAKKMIVVVMQYRLNVYGFYSTGDAASPGNYGLWDQRMALEWVNKEISNFGGDTSNVHIAGSSSGGAAVSLQLQYDQRMRSQGHPQLFQKATVMSGGIYEAWPNVGRLGRSMQDWTIKLSRHMIHSHLLKTKPAAYNESKPNTGLMASTIKAMSTKEIAGLLGAGMAKFPDPVFLMTGAVFISQGPVVDGTFVQSRDPFNVKTRASAGNYSGYHITYGTTNGEGYISFTGPTGLRIPGLKDYTTLDARMNQLHKVLSKMSDTELEDLWKTSWNPKGIENLLPETKKNWIHFEAMNTYNAYAAKSHNGYVAAVEDKAEETLIFETDKAWILPIMMQMLQTRAAGAAVKHYHLARGCNDGSDACQTGKAFWTNGYNLHGEDTSFSLGKVFCLANSTLIHRGQITPCKGNSTDMDKISSLQLIEYIQGNDKFETFTAQEAEANKNNFAVNADVFTKKDEIKRVTNFRQEYLTMRYQGRDMIWDAVEKTVRSASGSCGDEAHKKWSTAFDKWTNAQEKWQTSFDKYTKKTEL